MRGRLFRLGAALDLSRNLGLGRSLGLEDGHKGRAKIERPGTEGGGGMRSHGPQDQRGVWGLGPQRRRGWGGRVGSEESGDWVRGGAVRSEGPAEARGSQVRTCSLAATASERWKEKTSPPDPPSSPGKGLPTAAGEGCPERQPRTPFVAPSRPPSARPKSPRDTPCDTPPPAHLDARTPRQREPGGRGGGEDLGGGRTREEDEGDGGEAGWRRQDGLTKRLGLGENRVAVWFFRGGGQARGGLVGMGDQFVW